jgi:2-polyprenyl-6-hydroxyphenyl methylase/3-demethylubiquinone-9 3-methyltransferase
MQTHEQPKVRSPYRFPFGENWLAFLRRIDEERIMEAQRSLQEMLGVRDLAEKSFLDVGCGSGLFSLAARRLGARVHSFDYDPKSVACTAELKLRYRPQDITWRIEQASALDADYLRSLGHFDIVYSWGVLHHTGAMRQGMENVTIPLAKGGIVFIAIYNDEGLQSRIWRQIKKFYCSSAFGCSVVCATCIPYMILRGLVADIGRMKNPTLRYREYKRSRGMSVLTDWFDWLGGYPFEVATPESVSAFYEERGFTTCCVIRSNGYGCNQFVFRKSH